MSINNLDPTTPASDSLAGLGDDEIRGLKTALLACFPALEGTINNSGATGDPADLDPPDSATFGKLFDDVRALQGGLAGTATVPVGAIMLWSGAVSTIPAGWALCDGSGATPNLVDRFIVGADENAGPGLFNPGNTGGNNWKSGGTNGIMDTGQGGGGTSTGQINIPDHVLTETNLPAHEHPMFKAGSGTNTSAPGSGFSGYVAQSHPSNDDRKYVFSEAAAVADQGKTGPNVTTGTPDPLTHPPQDIEITGITHNHDYSPFYYALAYIQYIGV